jgi:hypothetical protein
MAFALVSTAEHYVSDILLGWAYALVALWLVNRVGDALRRSGGRTRSELRRVPEVDVVRPSSPSDTNHG